jgi:hypothetical protein
MADLTKRPARRARYTTSTDSTLASEARWRCGGR